MVLGPSEFLKILLVRLDAPAKQLATGGSSLPGILGLESNDIGGDDHVIVLNYPEKDI